MKISKEFLLTCGVTFGLPCKWQTIRLMCGVAAAEKLVVRISNYDLLILQVSAAFSSLSKVLLELPKI